MNVTEYDVLDPCIGNPNIPALSEEERLSCEDQIMIEAEYVKALDTFKAGKIPGNDGITAEFYKTFWNSVLLSSSQI